MASPPLDVVASLIAIPRRLACRNSAITAPASTSRTSPQVRTPWSSKRTISSVVGCRGSSRWKYKSSRSANRLRNSSSSSANWIGRICSGAPLVVTSA